jgi:hypothetical protein
MDCEDTVHGSGEKKKGIVTLEREKFKIKSS